MKKKLTLREKAHEQILKFKDECYVTNGRNASNELEGDHGTWQDWEDALVNFARKVNKNPKTPTHPKKK